MIAALLAALVVLSPQQQDTTTFHDAATAELYARARVRHIVQDSVVRDYRAIVETRMEARAGRSRFAGLNTLLAHESRARVTWRQPNDLKVEVLGPVLCKGLPKQSDFDALERLAATIADKHTEQGFV